MTHSQGQVAESRTILSRLGVSPGTNVLSWIANVTVLSLTQPYYKTGSQPPGPLGATLGRLCNFYWRTERCFHFFIASTIFYFAFAHT